MGWCYFSLSLVLFLCAYFLLNRFGKQRDQVASTQFDKDFFNGEIRALLTILIIFSSSYMLRGFLDILGDRSDVFFVTIMEFLTVGFIGDFATIMPLMAFHKKNFKKKIESNR